MVAHKTAVGEVAMPKGFDLRCGAGKTARVWLQGNNVIVCETDYRALKRGIEHLPTTRI
jgi:hypothetical protein